MPDIIIVIIIDAKRSGTLALLEFLKYIQTSGRFT